MNLRHIITATLTAGMLVSCQPQPSQERQKDNSSSLWNDITRLWEDPYGDESGYERIYRDGTYNDVPYMLWEQKGTWKTGFSIGDSTDYLHHEQEEYVVVDDRFKTTKNTIFSGNAPEIPASRVDSLHKGLRMSDRANTLPADYKTLLDDYTSQLRDHHNPF